MTAVRIEVYPNTNFSPNLKKALTKARANRSTTFTYRGTVFEVEYNNRSNVPRRVRAILTDLNAMLPPVFRKELRVSSVTLRSEVPPDLRATAGWYQGENFGFPGTSCCIDPRGEQHGGRPRIFVNGTDFASVTGLFRRVMSGGLTPGHNGNPWSTDIYN